MSACGWPEPSTGIRLPRGQCGHDCSSRVSEFSSRMARSRYFSRISSSVTGIDPEGFDDARSLSLRCTVTCACCTAARSRAAAAVRFARFDAAGALRARWAEAGVALVCRNFSACT